MAVDCLAAWRTGKHSLKVKSLNWGPHVHCTAGSAFRQSGSHRSWRGVIRRVLPAEEVVVVGTHVSEWCTSSSSSLADQKCILVTDAQTELWSDRAAKLLTHTNLLAVELICSAVVRQMMIRQGFNAETLRLATGHWQAVCCIPSEDHKSVLVGHQRTVLSPVTERLLVNGATRCGSSVRDTVVLEQHL